MSPPPALAAALRLALVAALVAAPMACNGRPAPPAETEVPSGWPYPARDAAPAVAAHGMVVSDAPIAAQVGLDVLRGGGNAVDAAVAVAFALAVVYPQAGNIGGGGFAVLRLADGTEASLDFRETAPAAAHRDMYLDAEERVTKDARVGHRSAGVPGSVAGLWELHRRHGTRPWAELVAPAIRLAEEGFPVDEMLRRDVEAYRDRLAANAASAALLLPGGEVPEVGAILTNPDLAATLRRIAEGGADEFYRGRTAELLVAEMRRGGGIIAAEDLASYRAVWREPIVFSYRGLRVISMPPPSSGGVTLALLCGILEGLDLAALGWHSPAHLHLLVEAMRRAYADRNAYLGDPDFVEVPTAAFLSAARAARHLAGIDRGRATPSAEIRPEARPLPDRPETTHFGVVDAHGNAVALTTTINDIFGASVTVTGAGFLLNDEMDDFAAAPGTPNMFGLVQAEANAIAPGKRPLSSMTPTIVLDAERRPLVIVGGRGGSRIITGVLQVLSNVVDFGMPVDDAVHAPRLHHQHLPDVVVYEAGGFTPEQLAGLEALGHRLEPRAMAPFPMNSVPALVRRGALWTGAGDPRRAGAALGW